MFYHPALRIYANPATMSIGMTKLKAVDRVTLGEQVALQLAEMITAQHWTPGTKLPSEADLCSSLAVGRSTLREALKSLAFIGMVRMRAGDGTYVADSSPGILDRMLAKGLLKTEKDLADVCETRLILETEMAGLAAERATADDLHGLDQLMRKGAERLSGDLQAYSEWDVDFHLAVANCSQNRLLSRLLIDVRSLLVEWITKSQSLPGMRENAHEQHQRITKSIRERNSEAARLEMREHLRTFQRAYTLLGRISDAEGGADAVGAGVMPQQQSASHNPL